MMLVHPELVPPDDLTDENDPRMEKVRTEYDVRKALLTLGHEVRMIAVEDDITPIRTAIHDWKPHIAFNLMEAFANNVSLDYYVVSYLDMLKVPYTGCNPRGMLLARDKALSLEQDRFRRPCSQAPLPHGGQVPAGTGFSRHCPGIVCQQRGGAGRTGDAAPEHDRR